MGDVIEILTTATNTVEVEAQGPQGIPGVGVPTGGSALQVLRKKTGTDYDTEWATGGGGASYNQELNTTDSVTFESVTADKVAFDLTAAETAAQGELAWNADEETLDLGLAHGSVLQVGQETLYHVENSTASTITAGTLCVFSGTVGNSGKLRVAAHANNTNPTAILGVATSTIAAGVGEEGYVTHFGKCRGINASGGAEAWANGDLLYASPTGGLTKTKPSAPIVTVAAVVSNSSSSGTLFVRPSFGQTAADVGAAPASGIDPTAITGTAVVDNDARLSDTRDPNAHAASHAAAGSDAVSAFSIGADSLFDSGSQTLSGTPVTLTASRARVWTFQCFSATTVTLPTTGAELGDRIVLRGGSPVTAAISISSTGVSDTIQNTDEQFSYTYLSTGSGPRWIKNLVDNHDAARVNSGTFNIARIPTGTGSTEVAAGDHTHELNALDATGITAGKILTADGDNTASWQDAPAGGDTVSIEASAQDVLSVASGAISAVDATADKIVFYDDSASELTYLELGSGLSISGTTLSTPAMTGATDSTAGTAGLVPQPSAGDEEKSLLGSGAFHFPVLPIIKSETTRGTSGTKRWIVPPFTESAAAGSSGGANFEISGGYVYIPYTGSYFYATVPAALYTTNTKTCWGLYNLASDGLAGTLAYDLGELDVGAGSNVICESANSISLNKGWYMCVSRANGSFNLWSPQSHSWINYILGHFGNSIFTTSASGKRRFFRALTYSTSLSSDLTSQAWSEDGGTPANLWFRRA